MKKDTFNYSKTRVLAGADEVIPLRINKNGVFICIQILACTDEDNSPARVDFGYLRGGSFVSLKSVTSPAAGFTSAMETTLFFIIDDIPAVRIKTAVIGDHIQMAISGYALYQDVGEF